MAPSPSPDAVLHLAGLHALAAAGFASTSRAASLTLSSAVAQYFRVVASACVERASLAGRNKVAAVDVVAALDDMGMNVDELYDWAGEQEEVTFGGLGGLETYLREGLVFQDPIAELKMVHEDDMGDEDDGSEEDISPKAEPVDEDTAMGEDEEPEVERNPTLIRSQSPDLSWLPPLPNTTSAAVQNKPVQQGRTDAPSPSAPRAATPAPVQSIADRYRRPIPYFSSQLAQTHPFADPPRSSLSSIPPAPTSLPNLISTYAATASEPSIALRQTDLRRQSTDLLRLSIATVDSYSPADTLTSPLPPIRSTPIVPSHSEVLPQRFLPVNPRPNGLLSSLVHQIHSPHLPPALRERLTSLRPPIAQTRDTQPILYGDAVRGPDEAALAKAKGKHLDSEGSVGEAWLSQTWDSGPKGMDKWSRGKLPSGKKVVMSKEGESNPREPEGNRKKEVLVQPLKLRLPSAGTGAAGGSSISPGPPTALAPIANGADEQIQIRADTVSAVDSTVPNGDSALVNSPAPALPVGPSLKFKFGIKKESNKPTELPGTPIPDVSALDQLGAGAATDPAAATIQQNGH